MVTLWLTTGLISSGSSQIAAIPDNTTQIVTVGFLLLR